MHVFHTQWAEIRTLLIVFSKCFQMNAPCRDNLCAGRRKPGFQVGLFSGQSWVFSLAGGSLRGEIQPSIPNHAQKSGICWWLLIPSCSGEESLHRRLCGSCAGSHCGKAATVLRIVSTVGLRQELQCSLCRRISQMHTEKCSQVACTSHTHSITSSLGGGTGEKKDLGGDNEGRKSPTAWLC